MTHADLIVNIKQTLEEICLYYDFFITLSPLHASVLDLDKIIRHGIGEITKWMRNHC